jgi:hypothetical protein
MSTKHPKQVCHKVLSSNPWTTAVRRHRSTINQGIQVMACSIRVIVLAVMEVVMCSVVSSYLSLFLSQQPALSVMPGNDVGEFDYSDYNLVR